MDVAVDTGECKGNGNAESKSVTIPERLLRRDQARQEDAERRKEAKESQSVIEEKSEFFSCTFNSERAAIEQLLANCPDDDRAVATRTLEEVTTKTQQLQKFFNDSIMFLTQYEIRQAQASLQKLQNSLDEKREEVLPKKKFAFRARSKATEKAATRAPDTPKSPIILADANVNTVPDGSSTQIDGTVNLNHCGFSNMDSVVLTKTAEDIHKQDVLLTHLTNCKVRLFGSPSTLHIKHVSGCEILCGPVSSSVFVDHCSNSTLAVPCQQLRTHNTTDTEVYLHVTSRAIIEDCRGVSFAPFSWSYPSLNEDFIKSGLDQNNNNWNQVDDFNWLAAGRPSPNWTIIPEEKRKSTWDL